MKRLNCILMLFVLVCISCNAQSDNKYKILLSGASFAEPNNKWFEMGCRALDAIPVNRAVSSESIANTANRMADGTLYSPEELDQIDVFVIMQVHEKDVYNSNDLKESYKDYSLPFDASDYAKCYDYVIKRYISECYKQKFNPLSKYYKSPYGKPAQIVLCTHWNDSRPLFNATIRLLADKWGLPVVEFDKLIGFSQNQKHPVTGEEFSCIFTNGDTQIINGKVHGWHPLHGEDSFVQQRMAAIFADRLRQILLPKKFIH